MAQWEAEGWERFDTDLMVVVRPRPREIVLPWARWQRVLRRCGVRLRHRTDVRQESLAEAALRVVGPHMMARSHRVIAVDLTDPVNFDRLEEGEVVKDRFKTVPRRVRILHTLKIRDMRED